MGKFIKFILMIILISISITINNQLTNAYADLEGQYLEAIRKDLESEEKEYYIIKVQMFEEDGNFGWEPEYLYLLTHGDNFNCTKIFIYKVEGDGVEKIWESIEFAGMPIEAWSVDFDEDWIAEHVLFTQKEDQNGTKWYQVWIFDWEGADSKLLYPKNIEDNKLTSLNMFVDIDYDKDWTYEFLVLEKVDDKNKYYKYYAFENNDLNKLIVEKEVVSEIKKALPQSKPKEVPIEEKYPEIVKLIREKHGKVEIYGIYDLPNTFRHMVLTDIGKIIVEQRLAGVNEWCVLDSSFNQYAFDPNMKMALDIDNDSIPEIPLYSYDTINNRKVYHYLVSVAPGRYKLLSPLDENGRSKIWSIDYFLHYDRTQDGNVVVIGFKESDDGYEDTYWKWEPKAQRLIEVLDY